MYGRLISAVSPADRQDQEDSIKLWKAYLRKLLDSELDRIGGLTPPLPQFEKDRRRTFTAKRATLPTIAMSELGDVLEVFAYVEYSDRSMSYALDGLAVDMTLYSLNIEFAEKPAVFAMAPPATPIVGTP